MLSSKEAVAKINKLWHNRTFLRAWLQGENIFPYAVTLKKPPAKKLVEDFSIVRDWISDIKMNSKEKSGFGYAITYTTISHRQLGKQDIPEKIIVESEDDFLKLIKKGKAFGRFKDVLEKTLMRLPELRSYIIQKPFTLLCQEKNWFRLLDVCEFFINNPGPGIYIRQISIPGIDTKFIESNKGILKDMLDSFLPDDAIDNEISGLSNHGFERHFGLKFDEPLIRFRLLDPEMKISGMSDISIPLSEFNNLDIVVKNIFITENKINGISFPLKKDSIVIFGLGYGIQSLKDANWLKNSNIYYWGDIDTHGFRILSMVRSMFENCNSLLMDMDTLLEFKSFWTEEDTDKRCLIKLDHLTLNETKLFNALCGNELGINARLEQEMIIYSYLQEKLDLI